MFKIITFLFLIILSANALEKLKIGVLAYGTVNWELDVLKHNKLDEKNGFELEFVKLASKNAQNVALQAGSVDIIVNDWIWVNTQREENKDFTFYPYSKATGTIYTPKDSEIKKFADLKGKELGISGGPFDKTWLILRAYAKKKYDLNLNEYVTPVYASAPILYEKMKDKSVDAAINYWHFNAKLKAIGSHELISMKNVLDELDIKNDVSFIGWTFNKTNADKNKKLYDSFIKATHEAKDILAQNDKEWDRIRPLMDAENDDIFEALKDGYKEGIIKEFGDEDLKASLKLFDILLTEGGKNLVGNSTVLQKDTFWSFDKK